MTSAKSSGITLKPSDAPIILGMELRGDRNHDIAAWFGVNQGRIAEVKDGKFGDVAAADPATLPPKGPPGIKGRRIRDALGKASALLNNSSDPEAIKALKLLQTAIARYDEHEK